jgi:dihydroorotase-like cyclic amidohydrolase
MGPAEPAFELVIRNASVHTSSETYVADIGIRGGRIAAIGAPGLLARADRVIEATGLAVLPGVWHTHCHFRDPGHTHKEDFESGTRAAAAGGVTVCVDQPHNDPHPTTLERFEAKRDDVATKALVDFALNGGGLHVDEIGKIAAAGAIAIKIFNTQHPRGAYPYIPDLGVTDHGAMYELFEAIADAGLLASVHHDDASWTKRMVYREFITPGRIDNKAYMEAYEKGFMYGHGMVMGLAHSLYLAKRAGVSLYVLHMGVMPVDAYQLLRFGKRELGLPVYGELEATSMLMTRTQAEKVGPYTYLWAHTPSAGWEALHRGDIDVLVLEHAPHTREELEPGWTDAFNVPLGVTGAQEFLPMVLTAVNAGHLTLNQVAEYCSERPAKLFGQHPRKGAIRIGSDADLTIVDMNRPGVLTGRDMHSKVAYTSWEGMATTAAPVYTIVRGRVAMDHGRILAKPGDGALVEGVAARSGWHRIH